MTEEEFVKYLKKSAKKVAKCIKEAEASSRRFDRTYKDIMRALRS